MTKRWVCGATVAGLVVALGSGSVEAAPERLGDVDLDRVFAGTVGAGTVGDIDQARAALIETVFLPRLLALQQRLAEAGSGVSIDIAALLAPLGYQLAPAASTLGVATARTADAAPGPALRSFLLGGPDATVSFFGASVGGEEVVEFGITETADGASAWASIVFSVDDALGTTVRSSGVSATATAGD